MYNFRYASKIILNIAIVTGVLFAFEAPARANVTASLTAANFPNQTVGTVSAPISITLTNTSSEALHNDYKCFSLAGAIFFSLAFHCQQHSVKVKLQL